jgi:hypothetical protein
MVVHAGSCTTVVVADVAPLPAFQRRPELPVVLAVLPRTTETLAVLAALKSELTDDVDVAALEYSEGMSAADLARGLDEHKPSAVVLMNNPTVRLFQQVQATRETPPTVVVMTAFVDDARAHLKNAAGIAYEVPGITLFVQLRSLLDVQVKRVGVVVRGSKARLIEPQRVLAAVEDFDLVVESVPERPTPRDVRRAVRALRDRGIDAVWVLNDNALLRSDVIAHGWKPALDLAKLPVVVGVRALVDPRVGFATLAMTPDPAGLGVQTASLLLDMKDNEWKAESSTAQPVSVVTVLDVKQARAIHHLRETELANVDVVLE